MEPKRRGLALTIIGAVVAFPVAIAVFVAAVVLGFQHLAGIVSDAPTVQSGSSLRLPSGTSVAVFTHGDDSFLAGCQITDPGGADVALDQTTSASVSGYDLIGTFETTAAGDYRFDCDSPAQVVSGDDAKGIAGSVFTWIGVGIALAVLIGVIGLVLLIIGIVKLVNSGRERRDWQQRAAYVGGYQPYGQVPGGYQPGGQAPGDYPPQQSYGQAPGGYPPYGQPEPPTHEQPPHRQD